MKTPCKVEFIKAWEDGTWETEVFEIPLDLYSPDVGYDPEDDAMLWCINNLVGTTKYRRVVYWGVYNINPDEPVILE